VEALCCPSVKVKQNEMVHDATLNTAMSGDGDNMEGQQVDIKEESGWNRC